MKLRGWTVAIVGAAILTRASAADKDPVAAGESHYYGGDLGSEKYSPLEQINTRNIQNLKVAWRHPGIDPQILETYPKLKISNNLRSTPLLIQGVLYVSNGVGF